jgi:hypothetical protein
VKQKQSLTYASEELVETVDTAVAIMECMMAEVGHVSVVE